MKKKIRENEIVMQVLVQNQPDTLEELLGQINAMLRAMHLWSLFTLLRRFLKRPAFQTLGAQQGELY